MKIEIDDKIKNEANKCAKDFDCLENEEHIYCQVESCVNGKAHFVKCLSGEVCTYKMPFGSS